MFLNEAVLTRTFFCNHCYPSPYFIWKKIDQGVGVIFPIYSPCGALFNFLLTQLYSIFHSSIQIFIKKDGGGAIVVAKQNTV